MKVALVGFGNNPSIEQATLDALREAYPSDEADLQTFPESDPDAMSVLKHLVQVVEGEAQGYGNVLIASSDVVRTSKVWRTERAGVTVRVADDSDTFREDRSLLATWIKTGEFPEVEDLSEDDILSHILEDVDEDPEADLDERVDRPEAGTDTEQIDSDPHPSPFNAPTSPFGSARTPFSPVIPAAEESTNAIPEPQQHSPLEGPETGSPPRSPFESRRKAAPSSVDTPEEPVAENAETSPSRGVASGSVESPFSRRRSQAPSPEPSPSYVETSEEVDTPTSPPSAPSSGSPSTWVRKQSTPKPSAQSTESPFKSRSPRPSPVQDSVEESVSTLPLDQDTSRFHHSSGELTPHDLSEDQEVVIQRYGLPANPPMRLGPDSAELFYFTGADGGSGKTTIAWLSANLLALAFKRSEARQDQHVYLIEADWENPKLEDRLGSERGRHSGQFARFFEDLYDRKDKDILKGRPVNEVVRERIDQCTTVQDTGLRVIVAPYHIVGRGAGEKAMTAAITYMITKLREWGHYVFVDAATVSNIDKIDKKIPQRSERVVLVSDGAHINDTKRAIDVLTTPTASNGLGVRQDRISLFLNNTGESTASEMVREFEPYGIDGFLPTIHSMDKMVATTNHQPWIGNLPRGQDMDTALQHVASFLHFVSPLTELVPFAQTRSYDSKSSSGSSFWRKVKGMVNSR